MIALLLILFALNALDLALTTHLVYAGLATEANPLLAWALYGGFWHFFGLKFGLLGLSLLTIYFGSFASPRALRVAYYGLWGASVVYTAVVLYQVYFLLRAVGVST